jgi:hypothetical protein
LLTYPNVLVPQFIGQKNIPQIIPPLKRLIRDTIIPYVISFANPLKHTDIYPLEMSQHFFFKPIGPFIQVNPFWAYFTIAKLIDSHNFYSRERLPLRERDPIPDRAPTCLFAASECHREILLDFPAFHKRRSKA